MTRSTFMDIAEQLRPFIEKEVTQMRTPITVEHRLAITLWRLATNIEYRSLGQQFGVGRSTVCSIVNETCRAIETHLMPKYIRFPEGQDLLDTVQQFRTKCKFPQVAGVIDCCHVLIKPPKDSPEDYFNQNQFYSVVLQAVVDADGKFINTDVGQPGSVHDARVFSLSSLSRKLSSRTLFNPNPTILVEGQEIPLLILGDSPYPLLPNLMKGYSDLERLTNDQMQFNMKISSAHVVVERTFSRLKGRWQIFNKTSYNQLDYIRPLVNACCTLHNICERNGDPFQQAWLSGVNLRDFGQHHHERPLEEASRIRDALKEYLKTQ
ncbi:protein ALP1-like [Anneissia japonica]|uniref:protein ALP1-like n=1 Tax=Anneissia japonica TaxID=1529436 RepID=UPI0014255D6A|nr:protein ALP1-like [Anneissia japonica]